MKITRLLTGVALAALAVGSVQAADLDLDETNLGGFPAVSAVNGKIQAEYVHYDFDEDSVDASGYAVKGALSVPLTERFGLQVDAGGQNAELDGPGPFDLDIESRGIGGHLFWRDPSVGLAGVYVHYENHEFSAFGSSLDVKTFRYGAEGELYHGDWTFTGFIGADSLEVDLPGAPTENYIAANAGVGYYFNENALVKAGISHSFEETVGTLGFEMLLDTGSTSPTLYADANFGEDATSVTAGLRVMFGPSTKSLQRRHREDDPTIGLFNNLPSLIGCALSSGPLIEIELDGDDSPRPIRVTELDDDDDDDDSCYGDDEEDYDDIPDMYL